MRGRAEVSILGNKISRVCETHTDANTDQQKEQTDQEAAGGGLPLLT